jgi:hypothetical protein
MTSKNISANITIGGSVSSSLGKSFGAVRKSLEGINDELKNLKEQQNVLEKQAAAAKKAGKSTAEYEKELKKLAKTQASLQARSGKLKSVSSMFSKPTDIKFGAISSSILGKMATSKSMGGITTSTLGLLKEFGPMLLEVGALAAGVVASLAAVAAGVFMVGKAAAETVDKTADMADGLGVSTEALQKLRYVAALSGIDADTFDQKLGKLTLSLESAKDGTGPTAAALQELGLSYSELSAMKPDEQFIALSTAMKSYNGNMPKMEIGQALFGKNSAKFVNMMNQGGDAIRENSKNAKVFSKEQINQADAFDKAWNKTTNTFESVWVSLGTSFLPVITSALNELNNYLNDPAIKENLAAFGEVFANVFSIVWFAAKRVIEAINFLITPVKWIVNASKWVGEKIGDTLFDQTGGSKDMSKAANQQKVVRKVLGSNNASLPESVSSGAAVNNNAVSNTTHNNNPTQNNTIIVNGASNPQLTAEHIENAISDGQMRMNAVAR